MRTKRFILITTILTLLIAGPLLIGGLLLPVRYQDTFMGELPYKLSRLENAPGKRIIVIGGSGMAFAVDSALLEQEFPGYTAVNMGMYADLGVRFLLDLTENELREGDIVILSPEQHTQTLSCWFGARSALQGTDGNISMLRYVSREDLGTLIGALPGFTLEKLHFMSIGEHPEGDGIYRRSSFNEYGDIDSEMVSQNIMPEEYDPDLPVVMSDELPTEEFADYLNDYSRKLGKKGASFYYHFCPVNELAVAGGALSGSDRLGSAESAGSEGQTDSLSLAEQSALAFYTHLDAVLDFPLLGDPREAVMEAGWFYDTNFHLNRTGRTFFTRQLVRDLKAALGDTSLTEIDVPAMPRTLAFSQMSDKEDSVLRRSTYAGNTEITQITVPETQTLIFLFRKNLCQPIALITVSLSMRTEFGRVERLFGGQDWAR